MVFAVTTQREAIFFTAGASTPLTTMLLHVFGEIQLHFSCSFFFCFVTLGRLLNDTENLVI